jgi:hypothetical protein
VTPPGLPPYGRVEAISPSTLTDGTAFASFDRHYSGDYAPYVFKTTNFGKTWTSLAAGLPSDQPVRTVRQDAVNPGILYAGLERSIWISFDGGHKWQGLQLNLPHTAVFDLRFQTHFDDMIIATHGRSAWVMDDIRPLQELDKAKSAGHYVFQPPTAYQYNTTEKAEGNYTNYGADNPPAGAIIDFFQTKAGSKPPAIDILDARGRLVRRYAGKHAVGTSGKTVAWVTNTAGVNRFIWDFSETPITPWYGAANKRARLPNFGGTIIPGNYSARVTFSDGQSLSKAIVVKPDPDVPWTQADYEAGYQFGETALAMYDNMNKGFNAIDAQMRRLKKLGTSQAISLADAGLALENSLTANYKNDEDGIMFPPKVREDVQGLVFVAGSGPVLPPQYRALAAVKPEYEQAMSRIHAWLAQAKSMH